MPRIREIPLDNLRIKICPFSYDEAEAFMLESKSMLERKATNDEWAQRTLKTVAMTLNKAATASGTNGHQDWTPETLKKEYDMVTIQEIYESFMKMSGLRPAVPGEAPATSISS